MLLAMALCILCLASRSLCESLEVACERWDISESVAGATVLSIGGSIPEIIINTISTTEAHLQDGSDQLESLSLGFGAILGSGLIAFLLIPGICLKWSPRPLRPKMTPLIRDCCFYFAMLSLISGSSHQGVSSARAGLVLVVYMTYITFLVHTSTEAKMELELCLLSKPHPNPLPKAALALIAISLASVCIMAVVNHWVTMLGVESGFLGLCVVALAAEIPDAVNAFSAASLGHGEMALAGCLGAQITNLALGLAGPLLTLSLTLGSNVNLMSPFTTAAAVVLMMAVVLLVCLCYYCPSKDTGLTLILCYLLSVSLLWFI